MHPWLRSQRPRLGVLLDGSLAGVLRQGLWVNLELANSAGFPLSKISLCPPPALGVQTQVLTRVQEAISPAHILIFQSAYHPRFPEKWTEARRKIWKSSAWTGERAQQIKTPTSGTGGLRLIPGTHMFWEKPISGSCKQTYWPCHHIHTPTVIDVHNNLTKIFL